MARQGKEILGQARPGKERQGKAMEGKARIGKAQSGTEFFLNNFAGTKINNRK